MIYVHDGTEFLKARELKKQADGSTENIRVCVRKGDGWKCSSILGSDVAKTVARDPNTVIPTTDESDIGRGSWLSEGNQNGDGFDDKFFLWLDPLLQPLNLGEISIADINHIAYSTKTPNPPDNPFYLTLYTNPTGVNDDASWYGHRLNGVPTDAHNISVAAGQWNRWHTRSYFTNEDNELGFEDSHHIPGAGVDEGPTLKTLQSENIDWSQYKDGGDVTSIDYSVETIKSIVFATASAWADDFFGYIDNLFIETTDYSISLDLEP